jgi:hypothetical protein
MRVWLAAFEVLNILQLDEVSNTLDGFKDLAL